MSSGACESPFKRRISSVDVDPRVSGVSLPPQQPCWQDPLRAVFLQVALQGFIHCHLFCWNKEWVVFPRRQNRNAACWWRREEGDACFFGMPHWQFNDWTLADGMELQFCTCTSSQQTSTLTTFFQTIRSSRVIVFVRFIFI